MMYVYYWRTWYKAVRGECQRRGSDWDSERGREREREGGTLLGNNGDLGKLGTLTSVLLKQSNAQEGPGPAARGPPGGRQLELGLGSEALPRCARWGGASTVRLRERA